jgi:hypothetical protein
VADGAAPLDERPIEVRDPDPADLAGVDESADRSPGVFDRHAATIRPMQLVEVDHVHTETAEGGVACRPDLLGPEPRPLGGRGNLRGEEGPVASPGEGLADQHLGDPIAVDLGGVDPVHPGVEAGADRIDHLRLRLVGTPCVAAGLPRAEADHR